MAIGINKFIWSLMIIIIADLNLFTCVANEESEKIKAIYLARQTPIINWDSSITIMGGTYNVYYYNDLLMYKLNYQFDSFYNNEPIFQETRSFYFIFHRDSAYGYRYTVKPDRALVDTRLMKDSLLRYFKFESNTYDTLINITPDSTNKKKGTIVKTYKNPRAGASEQQSEKFDLYFFYSKELAGIPETLSKKMDNEKGMKLVKILVKASGGFYKDHNMTFPPREIFLEMKQMKIENREEILSYFKKYRQQ